PIEILVLDFDWKVLDRSVNCVGARFGLGKKESPNGHLHQTGQLLNISSPPEHKNNQSIMNAVYSSLTGYFSAVVSWSSNRLNETQNKTRFIAQPRIPSPSLSQLTIYFILSTKGYINATGGS
ncbi:MAG: hypothetical protein L0L79_11225, partial [Lentilactobacillus parabuchneri]|uniref:hypothetical protein n=1 Tax=Lentilactobacillus parabuchneri TaxID=152331 RepID=UPI0026490468